MAGLSFLDSCHRRFLGYFSETDSRNARLFGLLLAVSIPALFIGGVVLGAIYSEEGIADATVLEITLIIIVGIISAIIARKIKNKPSEQSLI